MYLGYFLSTALDKIGSPVSIFLFPSRVNQFLVGFHIISTGFEPILPCPGYATNS